MILLKGIIVLWPSERFYWRTYHALYLFVHVHWPMTRWHYIHVYMYIICIWDMKKGYGIRYAPPPDQLLYIDDFAHSGRDDMMGCPQRLDDVMNTCIYARRDIYRHMHDIIILNDLQSYSYLHIESFYSMLLSCLLFTDFHSYILGTLFVLTSLLLGDAAFHARRSR